MALLRLSKQLLSSSSSFRLRSLAAVSAPARSPMQVRSVRYLLLVPFWFQSEKGPGADSMHYSVLMPKPNCDKKKMIDHYVKTLAMVVGSEEEAMKKIYNVYREGQYGFGCEVDEKTSYELEDLSGVIKVVPDSYVDIENKDYGGELCVNGVIVQRSPERERLVERGSGYVKRRAKLRANE